MDNKKLIIINVGIALFILLVWWVVSNWSEWGDEKDGNVLMQFVGIMAITLVLGVVFVTLVLPALGDKVGDFVYSAPEKVEPDAFAKAASKVSQGDYAGAIEAYKAIAVDEPENRFPIVEIAKIQQDHLKDPEAAIKTVENAVQNQAWDVNDAAFLMFRLQDLYLKERQDVDSARAILEQVMESFPDTRHSANAHHKINELKAMG